MESNLITVLYCRTAQKCDMGIESQETMLRSYAENNNYCNVYVKPKKGAETKTQ